MTLIRWILGLLLCLASIGGFANGDTGLALFILALGLLLLPPVTKTLFSRKQNETKTQTFQQKSKEASVSSQSFQSQINHIPFPDRVDAINWHINAINKGLEKGDLNLANLSYAKLIESIRQQNINEKGSYDDALKTIRAEYDQFRQAYNLEYPPQFLPPSERPKVKTEVQFDRAEIGMYNMNLHGYYKKQLSATRNQLYKYLSAYNEIVALACQGRIEEIEDIYSNELNAETYHGSFNQLMKQKKKQIMSMAKTAKKVDESKMTDLRNGESVGEYFDRKILKRSSFMELYNEMNDFDMAKYYEGEIKNNENITAANKRSKKSGGTVDIEDL